MTATFAGRASVSALTPAEVRVLGCLLEKQRTTPDVYPLSLNSLRLACNQSTNREPVVAYDDATIRDALHRLGRHGLTRLASGAGSRTAKYRHLLAEALPMDGAEQALLCVLMLRGPQTPGELKQRGERMHCFGELGEVHDTLGRLIERGLVERLPRRAGHKEERYTQLLSDPELAAERGDPRQGPNEAEGGLSAPSSSSQVSAAPSPGALAVEAEPRAQAPYNDDGAARALRELSERVARLEGEIAELRDVVGAPDGTPVP